MIKAIAMAEELEGCGAGIEANEMRRLSAIEQAATALIKCKDCQDADIAAQGLADALGIELPQASIEKPNLVAWRVYCPTWGGDGYGVWNNYKSDDSELVYYLGRPDCQVEYAVALGQPQLDGIDVVDLNRPSAIELQDAEVGIPEPFTELINASPASNRPNWDDAPEWANFWAVGENLRSYWYQCRPTKERFCWKSVYEVKPDKDEQYCKNWEESLVMRPVLKQ